MAHNKYDIYFDDTHDMTLYKSDIRFAESEDIVAQRLTIRLQFILGEWFLNNSVGLPYPKTIFEKGTSLTDIYELFRKEITNTEGVENIQTLELTPTPSQRGLRVDFEVNDGTINDTIEVSI